MALVPHKITALAESDADGTDGKNIIAGAVVSLFDSSGAAVTLFDDESGNNGSTAKQTDSSGQVVVWVTAGEYSESVNGSTQRAVTIGGRTVTSYPNTESLQNSRPTQTGQRAENRERAYAQYELAPQGTALLDGDIAAANGRLWALQIDEYINAGWFGLGSADDSAAINSAMNRAATIVESLLADKIEAVAYTVKLPSGTFNYSALDIPSGIMLEGQGSSTLLKDVGTSTSRASINVGTTTRESFRAGLKNLVINGGRIAGRDGVNFERAIRMCGLFDCTIFNFDNNVVNNDAWAFTFERNAVYDAMSNNFKLQNAVATHFSANRIEKCGETNVLIEGETGLEPITVTFNGDVIQGAKQHAIKGIDVVSMEVHDCFIEGNNQDGGFAAIQLIKGANNRQGEILEVSGGFFTPGTGLGQIAINATGFKCVKLSPIYIRSNLWNIPIRVDSDCQYLEITGQVIATGANFSGASEDCVIVSKVSDDLYFERGVQQQKIIKRLRGTSSSLSSQNEDATVLINTSAGGRVYTVRTSDIENGRELKIQKTSGDSNALVVQCEGGELINGSASVSTTSPYGGFTLVFLNGEGYAR